MIILVKPKNNGFPDAYRRLDLPDTITQICRLYGAQTNFKTQFLQK